MSLMLSDQFAGQCLQIIRVCICGFIAFDPNIYIRSAEWRAWWTLEKLFQEFFKCLSMDLALKVKIKSFTYDL